MKLQGRIDEAFDAFYKSTWNGAFQDCGFFSLAQIAAEKGQFAAALEYSEKSIVRNYHNIKARNLKTAILRRLGRLEAAENFALETIEIDKQDYCFPNTLYSMIVLEAAIEQGSKNARANYYLANLLYDKKQYSRAITLWEKTIELNSNFPTAHRNLALAYFNKLNEKEKAKVELEKAFELNNKDARVLFELDQLYKKLNISHVDRVAFLEQHMELVSERDDLYIEYVTLNNNLGKYEKAKELIMKRKFHPWEGGEGKVTSQYLLVHLELAKGRFDKLYDYGEKHLFDDIKIDYFAVSLPDFLVFDEDLNKKNLVHCRYLMGLGSLGLGNFEKGRENLQEARRLDINHQGVKIHLEMI